MQITMLKKLFTIAAFFAVAACVEKQLDQPSGTETEILTIHASSGDEAETRTYINHVNGKDFMDWNTLDYIYVFDTGAELNNGHVFKHKKDENGNVIKGTFECAWSEGKIPEYALFNRINDGNPEKILTINAAGGVKHGNSSAHNDFIIVNVPDKQHIGNYNSFGGTCNVAVGKIENKNGGYSVKLQNVCGLVKFTLNEKPAKVTFKGNNNEIIAGGRIRVCFNTDGTPFWKSVSSEGSREIVMTTNDNIWSETNEFYLCVLPPQQQNNSDKNYIQETNTGTFTKGITITVETADGFKYTKTSQTPLTITRNKVVNLGNLKDPDAGKPVPGRVLPEWSEGNLDIHFINSGNGECTFFIMPDGTTMLVDAGEMPVSNEYVSRKPDASTRSYKVYSKYIQHFMPEGHNSIDWCAPSHFHIDHVGTSRESAGTHSEGGFPLTGLLGVYGEIPFDRVLDLGYPDYNSSTYGVNGELVTDGDWQEFVNWAVANKGMTAGRFTAGKEQITLVHNKAAYSDFKIFNFIANAQAWYKKYGIGFLEAIEPSGTQNFFGNPASAGFHISYGNFDYMTAGDLEGAPQNRLAYYYRDYLSGGLDVFKANHHFNPNSWGSQMRAQLDPRVILAHITMKSQPDWDIVKGIKTGSGGENTYKTGYDNDIFFTNLDASQQTNENASYLTDYNGHIVVRVASGGDQYHVYMLDDTNFDYKIKAVYGPYNCK